MGKPKDPEYFRKWRAAHPEYVEREKARRALTRAKGDRGDRSEEYKHRALVRATVRELAFGPDGVMPPLYPNLQHGKAFSFWEDELRMDLGQERELAKLEGIDEEVAVKEYRRREGRWKWITVPFLIDADAFEGDS